MAGTLYLVATPHWEPGGPLPRGGGHPGPGGLHRRRGHPGDGEAPEPPGAEETHGELPPPQRPGPGESWWPGAGGEDCALVPTPAPPAISDPGEELVAQCAQQGIPVVAIPGACAFVNALAVSGLPTGRFTFEGFLPMNKKNRKAHLDSLRGRRGPCSFTRPPHKLFGHLKRPGGDLRTGPAGGPCAGSSPSSTRRCLADHPGPGGGPLHGEPAQGEFVLVVEGRPPSRRRPPPWSERAWPWSTGSGGGWSTRDAVKEAASRAACPGKPLYDLAVANQPAP